MLRVCKHFPHFYAVFFSLASFFQIEHHFIIWLFLLSDCIGKLCCFCSLLLLSPGKWHIAISCWQCHWHWGCATWAQNMRTGTGEVRTCTLVRAILIVKPEWTAQFPASFAESYFCSSCVSNCCSVTTASCAESSTESWACSGQAGVLPSGFVGLCSW